MWEVFIAALLTNRPDLASLDFEAMQSAIGNPNLDRLIAAWINHGCAYQIGLPTFDLDADPCLFDGARVEEHEKGGKWVFGPATVQIHLTRAQQVVGRQLGTEWLKEMRGVAGFNATFIDCLFDHQDHPIVAAFLTPLHGKALLATKTVLRDGDCCGIRYLQRRCKRWERAHLSIGSLFDSNDLALIPASKS